MRIRRGVRQGCPLSPLMFDLFIDDLDDSWEKHNEGGVVIGGEKIFCFKFADDIAAVAEDFQGLNSMLSGLEKYGKKNGLEVNVEKTKVMVFRNGGRLTKKENWRLQGQNVGLLVFGKRERSFTRKENGKVRG